MTVLLSALALLAASHTNTKARGEEFFVQAKKNVPIERLAAAVAPMGKIESRERGTSTYLIELKPGLDDDVAKKRLSRIPGVRALDADEEPFDMTSIRSLDRKIAHLTADEAEERKEGHGEKALHERDKADYLKAYRYFVGQRAFPHDTVNWPALAREQERAAKIAPATALGGHAGIHANSSATWSFVGPTNLAVPYSIYYGIAPINGRVNTVAFDPNNSQIMYAGGAQGGVWKTTNGGSAWSWLSSGWTQLGVNDIVVDPQNGSTIYVARGDYHGEIIGSYGIMKSTDGGSTWTEIAESSMGQVGVNHILIDPTNDQVLIAGTGDPATGVGFLYRSTNGGATWTQLSVGGQFFIWPTIAASAVNGTAVRFYAVAAGYASSTNATSRVYKSDDHGQSWQLLPSPVVVDGQYDVAYEVATSPTNPNNVYVLDSQHTALYTSTNQGSTWNDQSANLPTGSDQYNFSQSWYDFHLECGTNVVNNVSNDVLFLGEIDITESFDQGNTWTSIGGPTYADSGAIAHNDQHALAVCPTNTNLALFSNDGGVYTVLFNPSTSTNTVNTLNQFLGNTMFYHTAFHPTQANYMLGGTQDNATPLSTGDLSNWLNVGGGDGGGCAINQTNPQIQYCSSEELGIYQTPDGWVHENYIAPSTSSNENLPFVCTIALDPENQYLMYTGTNYLYQWNENTQTWNNQLGNQDLSNGQGGTIAAIAVAPTDSNRIYTGTSDAALNMTENQGNTWTELSATASGLPNLSITSISVSKTTSSDILVGYSGTGAGVPHIYRCTNTTAGAPVFTSVGGTGSGALPDVSLNAIARDITNPATTWYVATDLGVFQTTNSGATWSNAGAPLGLPNVIVDDLVSVPGTGYLNAGTYGRGLWRIQFSGSSTLANFSISPSTVAVGGTSTGTVTLTANAPAGGAVVNLSSSSTSVATVPSTVTVPAGSSTANFAITAATSLSASSSTALTATYSGVSLTQTLTVNPVTISSVTLNPTSVVGGASSAGTITLTGNAPTGGFVVSLTSSSSSAKAPSSVTVPAGSSTVGFTVSTSPVATTTIANITASLNGSAPTASLTINAASLSGVSVSPTSVVGGNPLTGTVTLNGNAGTGGSVVTLLANNAHMTMPSSVTVPAGQSSVNFTINTTAVSSTVNATITASQGAITEQANFTITPSSLSAVTVSPTSVLGGATSTGTVTLTGVAGTGGTVVSLKSSSSAATAPASVTVAAGATSATFTIKTTAVSTTTSATITATAGSTSKTATLTITPVSLTGITVSPTTVIGGASSTGTLTINGAAPTGGAVVNLTSSTTSAKVPSSVTVAAGATSATFTITTAPVAASTSASITGTLNGASKAATLSITPPALTGLTISPTSVIGGASATGTVTLSGAAPTGGTTVSLSSSNAAATTPTSVVVAAGSTSGTFTIKTSAVTASASATIAASASGVQKTATLTVQPVALVSVSVSPTTVVGGGSSTGTVTLNGAAPSAGVTVALSSSTVSATLPSSVKVASGATTATFTISTTVVTTNTTATITAKLGTAAPTAALTIQPATLAGVALSPTTVVGGSQTSITGTVKLTGAAPSAGVTVTLASSNTKVATVPASVKVAAGASSATFTVSHLPVTTSQTVTITATSGGVSQTATLTVTPFQVSSLTLSPTSVIGGVSATGTITLNAKAGSASGAISVKLTSTSKAVSFPSSVSIPVGSSSATFTITTTAQTTASTATIVATYGASSQQAALTIQPAALLSVSVSPTSVQGKASTTVTGTVTLTGIAPTGGLVVTLKSSNTAAATVPASVTISAGKTSVTFTVTHHTVSASTTVTITATQGSTSKTTTLTVTP